MKKFITISIVALSAALVISCDDRSKPGKIYMPDMAYSRAYETYAERDSNKFTTTNNDWNSNGNEKIFYNNQPVAGTISRGEELPYHLKNDSTGYAQSGSVANPLPKLTEAELIETERQYLINCAICHGAKLNGNGPLYKDGTGPYPAKPATLVGDAAIEAKGEGTYYHSMTYGKNLMGSYASQLSRKQRWMLAQYIKLKQQEAKAGSAGTKDSAAAKPIAVVVAMPKK